MERPTWMKMWTALACAASLQASAQVVVSKPGDGKIPLDSSGFRSQGESAMGFQTVLQQDLIRSGWFSAAGAGRGQVRLLGSALEKRGELEVKIQAVHTGENKAYLSKAYREPLADARRMAHVIADEIIEAVTGKPGIFSTRITAVSDRSGRKEIYLCDGDGGGLIQLTRDQSVSLNPRWGPQAAEIVYTGYLKGFPDVYRIILASGARDRVAGYPGLNMGADISPDGNRVALILSKDGNPELYVKDLRGGRLIRLTQTGKANEASPRWSPDGKRIVYVSDQAGRPQLYMIQAMGGRPERLTVRGTENAAPDWGPNGWIAHSSRLGGQYQIMMIHPDTREVRQISSGAGDWEDPSWARDGRHLVCARKLGRQSQLYILDTLGDPPIGLSNLPGNWYSPDWSPK